MKKVLISIYKRFINIKRELKWYYQSNVLRKNVKLKITNSLPIEEKYLLLLPHADDEWIAASTLIADSKYDIILCDMDMPGGDDSTLHLIRKKELLDLANFFNREIHQYSGSLVEIIESVHPTMMLIPFFIDWHEEHISTINCLKDAIELGKYTQEFKVAMYQVSIPVSKKYITHAVPMTREEWHRKWTYFRKFYLSQLGIPYKRFAFNERIAGAMCNSHAAEVFFVSEICEWLTTYARLLPRAEEQRLLKSNIDDLNLVRRDVERYLNCRNG